MPICPFCLGTGRGVGGMTDLMGPEGDCAVCAGDGVGKMPVAARHANPALHRMLDALAAEPRLTREAWERYWAQGDDDGPHKTS